MISEDYVTYETAKLLKEKGFDEPCECAYTENGQYLLSCYYGIAGRKIKNSESLNFSYSVVSPTLQMTMKWLREVHGIDIEVRTHYLNYLKPNDIRYYSGKILKGSEDVIHTIYSKDTYEQVAEAGIRYCLENLI